MPSSTSALTLVRSAVGLWLCAGLSLAQPSPAEPPERADELDFNALLQPVPPAARFSDPDYYIWCGTMVRGDDGKCHLFYSRWPRKLGHYAWVTHSEVAHAVADGPLGAFRHVGVALPARGAAYWDGLCTHNPTVRRFGGKYYLYYMGNTGDGVAMKTLNWTHRNNQRIGVAVADSPDGPWTRFDAPLIAPTPGFIDALCCANPSVTERIGGGFIMVYKAVGDQGKPPFGGPVLHAVAFGDSPIGPFRKQPKPVFVKEGVAFAAEDPFIWTQQGRYWAIVKDNAGNFTHRGKSTALFESADGLDWRLAKHALVATTEITWEGGRRQTLNSLERPQVYFEAGRPAVLLFACDEDGRREHSFNVRIPLKSAGEPKAASRLDPAYEEVADDPNLPRVLLIGDSVSVGYTLAVRKELSGKANVHRPPQNCGSSAVGLANVERWLGDKPWDVIHFNHGLHDLSYEFSPGKNMNAKGEYARPDTGGHHRVSPDDYRQNLTKLVALLRAKAPNAKLIFATTTPVSADLHHYVKDSELEYNRIAADVMGKLGVEVNDLWAFAKPRIAELQQPGNPHFTAKGSQALAKEIAQQITGALK